MRDVGGPTAMDVGFEFLQVLPMHECKHLIGEACNLLNSEWPRSKTARFQSLFMSCEKFPTSLVLVLNDFQVVGHVKLSEITVQGPDIMVESVIISKQHRGKGWGKMLMEDAEEYVRRRGKKMLYLSTRGQEGFYEKLGYEVCKPILYYGVALEPSLDGEIKVNGELPRSGVPTVNGFPVQNGGSAQNAVRNGETVENAITNCENVENGVRNGATSVENVVRNGETVENTVITCKTVENAVRNCKTVENAVTNCKTVENAVTNCKTVENAVTNYKTVENAASNGATSVENIVVTSAPVKNADISVQNGNAILPVKNRVQNGTVRNGVSNTPVIRPPPPPPLPSNNVKSHTIFRDIKSSKTYMGKPVRTSSNVNFLCK